MNKVRVYLFPFLLHSETFKSVLGTYTPVSLTQTRTFSRVYELSHPKAGPIFRVFRD
ncbi:hypothetical protein BURKHO8Y_280028 [Burkholderia sp. 8Y]|nr:hypothetical protein BURKHO8Y_280028 [Burkholderia sp. 8Y]